MYFRICQGCGAYLDPGEICDCAEKAAPGGNDTEDGKGVISAPNISNS